LALNIITHSLSLSRNG